MKKFEVPGTTTWAHTYDRANKIWIQVRVPPPPCSNHFICSVSVCLQVDMQGNVGNVKLYDLLESDKFGEVLYDPSCVKSLTYVTKQHGSEVISQEEAVDKNEKFDPFADPAPQTVSRKRTLPSLTSGAAGAASSAPDPMPTSVAVAVEMEKRSNRVAGAHCSVRLCRPLSPPKSVPSISH